MVSFLFFCCFIYLNNSDLGWCLGEFGASPVPPRSIQKQAINVDSTHILWWRSRYILPHHPRDVVAEGDGVQRPALGQVGACRFLTHGGQKTLRQQRHTFNTTRFFTFTVPLASVLTCGLKKPVSQNWLGRPVLIQPLSCWFLSSSSLNQKPSVADGQLSRSHRRGIRASNMQSRASRRSSDMMMVPATTEVL